MTVLRNPQSILCGVIAGLIFIPTTIFDMQGLRQQQLGAHMNIPAEEVAKRIAFVWSGGTEGVLSPHVCCRKSDAARQ